MNQLRRHFWKILVIISVLLLVATLTASPARAFDGRSGDVVVIDANEVINDNVFVSARDFTLDGVVNGDLVVVGGTVTINGTVTGNLFAAGQSVTMNGMVGYDAFLAGYALTVSGTVTKNIIGAGFSLEQKNEASVGGDLIFAGYQAILAGNIGQDVVVNGSAVDLNITVGRNMTVNVGGSTSGAACLPASHITPTCRSSQRYPTG